MKESFSVALAISAIAASASAQDQVVRKSPSVIRVTSNYVLVDVTVRDKDGRPVAGLKPEDFRVYEEGVLQNADSFREIALAAKTGSGPLEAARPLLVPQTQRDVELVPEMLREKRIFALLFNLASMEDEDVLEATQSARDFANKIMTPDDAVAIYTYGNGLRLLTNFTNSKAVVLSAIAQVDQLGKKQEASKPDSEQASSESESDPIGEFVADEAEFSMFDTNRQLSAIESLIQLYKELPQRKSVLFFSSGLTSQNDETHQQLRWTVDLANRNNTTLYTVDTRGLIAVTPGARASSAGPRGTGLYSGQAMVDQMTQLANSQEALVTLAKDTGGRAMLDSNDLTPVYRHVQEDSGHYYLIGYRSSDNARDGKFRRIQVQVASRSDVTLRYRQGYTADKEYKTYTKEEKERQLQQAVLESRPRVDFTLEVATAQFLHRGLFIYAPVLVKFYYQDFDARAAAGKKRHEIDLVGFLKSPSGIVLQSFRDRVIIEPQTDPSKPTSFLYQNGFSVPAGRYAVRIAARENESGGVSAVDVPLEVTNLKQPELATSSIIMGARLQSIDGSAGGFKITAASQNKNEKESVMPSPLQVGNQELVPNLSRRFSRSQPILLSFDIYHAVPRDFAPVVDVAATILGAANRKVQQAPPLRLVRYQDTDARQIRCNFRISTTQLAPGQYTLAIEVNDRVAGKSTTRRATFTIH